MKSPVILTAAVIAAGFIGTADATTINVAAGGNVQAAIDTAAATGDEVVLASGNYSGAINISGKSLVLRGASAASRPVFLFNASNPYGSSTAGLAIRGDGTSDTVKDIIFIPAATGFTKAFATATLTAGATQTVNVTNCVFACNNGSDQPASTDPFSAAPSSGTWPNDIFYFNNGGFITAPAGVGIYNVTDCTLIGAGRDAFICYPNAAGSKLTVTGTAIAHASRNGIQWGDDDLSSTIFTISGTRAKPGLIVRDCCRTQASAGLAVDGINGGGTINISRLVYTENPANALGFIITADNTANVTISDSLFASNVGKGLNLGTSGSAKTPTVTVSKSTFFANGTGLEFGATPPAYIAKDNVFAGAGTGVNILTGVGAKVTMQNNALVTAGANALTAQLSGEAPASNTGVVTADPQFPSTSVASLSALQTSFNTVGASYATASSTAGPLSGWGTWSSGPAAVGDWSLFQ